MCEGTRVGPGVAVRSNRLRVEEVEICVSDGLRRRMEGCSQGLPRRKSEVCLSERVGGDDGLPGSICTS
jgi:hypothetical protein